ncbi:hypothetical protein LCGC14_2369690 [marine sediment metagenome]|uniref:Uncharacterized protein n=1 Tax=marine sediment metagenome TaxID=412755 RepID=A0A0F9CRC1_9ZZZZ
MTNSNRYEKIRSVITKIKELIAELNDLLRNENLKEIIQSLNRDISRLIEKADEDLIFFYSRINFSDRGYKLQRVIDGDTIIVDPPPKYLDMKDIRVRLYGIDTPELRFKKGKLFKDFLIALFKELDYKKIIIFWDREKENTYYEGFPTSSFEREVGNVFIEIDNNFLYLNGLLLMYPDVSSNINNKDLIKGRKYIKDIVEPFNHYIKCNCNSEFLNGVKEISYRFFEEYELINWIPLCLIYFNKNILKELRTSSKVIFEGMINSLKEFRCPFFYLSDIMELKEILKKIESNKINPFDLILLAAENWKKLLLKNDFKI